MADMRNNPAEMESLAAGLDAGVSSLDRMGPAPVANAGESTGLVANAIGRLMLAAAGVSNGIHESADNVRAAGTEYHRTDGAGADGMPKPR